MSRYLFIGIVGHAMRGLAYAAKQQGHQIIGLDEAAQDGPGTDWLDHHQLQWTRIPSIDLLDGVDLVIISGGTPADDPITTEATARGIAVVSFAEFLGEMTLGKRVIAVAGTHGKTTTSALITWLLESAGRQPDYLIGIQPFNFDSSARLTGSDIVVIEGDEYKASSLNPRSKLEFYHPNVLVLTSVEMDHPDVFRDLNDVKARFAGVIAALPAAGRLVAWHDGPAVMELAGASPAPVTTYGLANSDIQAQNVTFTSRGLEFELMVGGESLGELAVPLYGRHNVVNALAASTVVLGEHLSFDELADGMISFKGAYRRFNVLTPYQAKITVVDDYAHHPTEVATTIEAAKLHFPGRRLLVVFRPHTYSRTKTLLPELQAAFSLADMAYITDIEGAREAHLEASVSGADVVAGIGNKARYMPNRDELEAAIVADARLGDVVLCLTVSGHDRLANVLAERLNDPR